MVFVPHSVYADREGNRYRVTASPRFVREDGKTWMPISKVVTVKHNSKTGAFQITSRGKSITMAPKTQSMRTSLSAVTTAVRTGMAFGPVLDLSESKSIGPVKWTVSGGKRVKNGWVLDEIDGVQFGIHINDWQSKYDDRLSLKSDEVSLDLTGLVGTVDLDPNVVDYTTARMISTQYDDNAEVAGYNDYGLFECVFLGLVGPSGGRYFRVALRFDLSEIDQKPTSAILYAYQYGSVPVDGVLRAINVDFPDDMTDTGCSYMVYQAYQDTANISSPNSGGTLDKNLTTFDVTDFCDYGTTTDDYAIVHKDDITGQENNAKIYGSSEGYQPYLLITLPEPEPEPSDVPISVSLYVQSKTPSSPLSFYNDTASVETDSNFIGSPLPIIFDLVDDSSLVTDVADYLSIGGIPIKVSLYNNPVWNVYTNSYAKVFIPEVILISGSSFSSVNSYTSETYFSSFYGRNLRILENSGRLYINGARTYDCTPSKVWRFQGMDLALGENYEWLVRDSGYTESDVDTDSRTGDSCFANFMFGSSIVTSARVHGEWYICLGS